MVCFDKSERPSVGQTWRIRKNEFRAVIRRWKYSDKYLCALPEVAVHHPDYRLAFDDNGKYCRVEYGEWLKQSMPSLRRDHPISKSFTEIMDIQGWRLFVHSSHFIGLKPKLTIYPLKGDSLFNVQRTVDEFIAKQRGT